MAFAAVKARVAWWNGRFVGFILEGNSARHNLRLFIVVGAVLLEVVGVVFLLNRHDG